MSYPMKPLSCDPARQWWELSASIFSVARSRCAAYEGRAPEDQHRVREAGTSSKLAPFRRIKESPSNTGFSGSFLRSRNTRQRRGRRCGRERFESSQEQQSLEAFVDHGVQTFFHPQVFEHLRNSCCFSQFDELISISPPANQCVRLALPARLGNPGSLRSGRAVAYAAGSCRPRCAKNDW
jgi:hypothetical protein